MMPTDRKRKRQLWRNFLSLSLSDRDPASKASYLEFARAASPVLLLYT